MKFVQQGDVLFFGMEELPQTAKRKTINDRRGVVFAEGEVTGHYHACALDQTIEIFENLDAQGEKEVWAVLTAPKEVKHQEHDNVTLEPGIYKIGIVREIDPFSKEIREVAD